MDKQGMDLAAIQTLTRIGSLTDRRRKLENEVAELVPLARAQGASWRLIGVALGTTTQAAWDRFSGHQRDSEIPSTEPLPLDLD